MAYQFYLEKAGNRSIDQAVSEDGGTIIAFDPDTGSYKNISLVDIGREALANDPVLGQKFASQFPGWAWQNGQLVQTRESKSDEPVPRLHNFANVGYDYLKSVGLDAKTLPTTDGTQFPLQLAQMMKAKGVSTMAGISDKSVQMLELYSLANLISGLGSGATRMSLDELISRKITNTPNTGSPVQAASASGNQGTITGYREKATGLVIPYTEGGPNYANSSGWEPVYGAQGGGNSERWYIKNQVGDLIEVPKGTPGAFQQGGSSGEGGIPDFNLTPTGNPEMDAMLKTLQTYLNELKARGQVLNPNIDITPEKAAEFLAKAESEINPYYQGQLKMAREQLLSSAGYAKDQLEQYERQLASQYNLQHKQLGEQAADQGFAQSGIRKQGETQLATEVQDRLTLNRQQLQNQLGNVARSFAQNWGTSELPGLNISRTPQVTGMGSFQTDSSTQPFYSLSPEVYNGLIGTEEFNRRGAVQQRVSQLESAFRTQGAIDQARKLIL